MTTECLLFTTRHCVEEKTAWNSAWRGGVESLEAIQKNASKRK